MDIYLSSRFEHQAELRERRSQIEMIGHTVTSRWLDCLTRPMVGTPEWTDHMERWLAVELEDIDRCETLLLDTTVDMRGATGGAYVEFGYAIGRRKNLWIVGSRPNIFCYHPDVLLFRDWDQVFRLLASKESDAGPIVPQIFKLSVPPWDPRQFEVGAIIQVPQEATLPNCWAHIDVYQRYADPGTKVLQKSK